MRGSLTPMLGAIGACVCLTALTRTISPDVVPDDVYAWRCDRRHPSRRTRESVPLGRDPMRTPTNLRWRRYQSGNPPKSSA
jgi:hypothetical protein